MVLVMQIKIGVQCSYNLQTLSAYEVILFIKKLMQLLQLLNELAIMKDI